MRAAFMLLVHSFLSCIVVHSDGQLSNSRFKRLHQITETRADLNRLLYSAQLCDLAYKTDEVILSKYPDGSVILADESGVRFFYHMEDGQFFLSIRGTKNFYNWLVNAKFNKDFDERLNIWVHWGFLIAAKELYSLLPLEKILSSKKVFIQGHSLGGAIAILLSHWYRLDGLSSESINLVSFGQPRITNAEGATALVNLQDFSFERVILNGDLVPYLPPENFYYAHYQDPFLIEPVEALHSNRFKNSDSGFPVLGTNRSEVEINYKHRMTHYVDALKKMLDDQNSVSFPE